jgi:Uma2 family endonuclease
MAATALLECLDTAVRPETERLDDDLYEIVDGHRIEIAPMSAYAAKVASRLATEINFHAWPDKRGEAVVESLFRLPLARDSGRNRKPDVAFVSSQRWPPDRPQPVGDNAWDVVPDLAVEVVSPHDEVEDLLDKVSEYFEAGVRLVWVIFPRHRQAHVYESADQMHQVTEAGTLDGGAVLAGFQLPLSRLFDPVAPADAGPAAGP